MYAAFLMAAATGMRRGEILGLRWTDVDLDSGRIAIRQTLIIINHKPTLSEPKTDRSRRSLRLDPATLAALKSCRARQLEERLAWGAAWTDTGLVFTGEDGTLVHPQSLSDAFERRTRNLGLPPIRLHDYADVRVMPTSARNPLQGHVIALRSSA
jgi:integrase